MTHLRGRKSRGHLQNPRRGCSSQCWGLGRQQAPFIHPLISAAPPPAASAVVNTPNQQPLGVWVSKYTTGYHIEGLKELSSIYAPTFHEATSSREQSPKVPNPLQAFVVRRQSCWNWLIEGSSPPPPRPASPGTEKQALEMPGLLQTHSARHRQSTERGDYSLQVGAGPEEQADPSLVRRNR